MVDRVYKKDLPPAFKSILEGLREGFRAQDSKTHWTDMRIDPLLRHVNSLQTILDSEQFQPETARLRKGVRMFHSDMVYFRTNIHTLKEISLR